MIYYDNTKIYMIARILKGFSPIFKQLKKNHAIRIFYDKLSQFGQTPNFKQAECRTDGPRIAGVR